MCVLRDLLFMLLFCLVFILLRHIEITCIVDLFCEFGENSSLNYFIAFCVFERDPLLIILKFYGVLLNFIGCNSYSLLFQGDLLIVFSFF